MKFTSVDPKSANMLTKNNVSWLYRAVLLYNLLKINIYPIYVLFRRKYYKYYAYSLVTLF